MKKEEGERLKIHGYKHNRQIHRSWDEAVYLGKYQEYEVFGNNRTLVTESDGRTWKTKEPAILFFSREHWYNIIGQIKTSGIYYYCNIASPYIIEEDTIKYIDYDLDLRVFPDGSFKILDRGEYQYHKKIMNYSKEIDTILKSELNDLIEKVRKKEAPFNSELINEYNKKYKNAVKLKNK